MKSARLLSIAYNSYTKPKLHESSRYNLWLSHVRLYLRMNLRRCLHVETSSLRLFSVAMWGLQIKKNFSVVHGKSKQKKWAVIVL